MTDGVIMANMTSNDAIESFAPDTAVFGGEYFTEKLETKSGWNRPSVDDDWFRGFAQEIEDFVSAVQENREPRSGHRIGGGLRRGDLRRLPVGGRRPAHIAKVTAALRSRA